MKRNCVKIVTLFDTNMQPVSKEENEEILEIEREEQEGRELEDDLLATLYTARYPIR